MEGQPLGQGLRASLHPTPHLTDQETGAQGLRRANGAPASRIPAGSSVVSFALLWLSLSHLSGTSF